MTTKYRIECVQENGYGPPAVWTILRRRRGGIHSQMSFDDLPTAIDHAVKTLSIFGDEFGCDVLAVRVVKYSIDDESEEVVQSTVATVFERSKDGQLLL